VGILAGPLLGALIALVVNIFSAALGHGAVGLLGANTLVNASEAIVAYYAFRTLLRMDWDEEILEKWGGIYRTGELAREYRFTDVDGSQPAPFDLETPVL
jgi:ABC-type Co2+ transport system permease subunit